MPAGCALDRILCLKTTRCLRKDFTIAHQGALYQIHDTLRASHVRVEERVDGTMRLTHKGRPLAYHAITARPVKAAAVTPVPPAPAPGHAEAGASMAQTPAAGTTRARGGGHHLNRTFLFWEEEDISILA